MISEIISRIAILIYYSLMLLEFFFLITKPELKWVIEKEKKKVGEYNCLKATTEIIVNSKGKKE